MSRTARLQYNWFILFIILSAAVFSSFTVVANLGAFQVKILSLDFKSSSTSHSMDLDDSPTGSSRTLTSCSNSSLTIKACLSHHQLPLPRNVQCTLGQADGVWLLSNQKNSTSESVLSLPFAFAWPGAFTLSLSAVKSCHSDTGEEVQLSSLVVADYISPSLRWTLVIKSASTRSKSPVEDRSTNHLEDLQHQRSADYQRITKRDLRRATPLDTNVDVDTPKRKKNTLNVGNAYLQNNINEKPNIVGEVVRDFGENDPIVLHKTDIKAGDHVVKIRGDSEKHTLGPKSDSFQMKISGTNLIVSPAVANFRNSKFLSNHHSKTERPSKYGDVSHRKSIRRSLSFRGSPHSKITIHHRLKHYFDNLDFQQVSTQSSDESLLESQTDNHLKLFQLKKLSVFLKQVKRKRSVSEPELFPFMSNFDVETSELQTTEDSEEIYRNKAVEVNNDERIEENMSKEAIVRSHGADMTVAVRVVCRENYYGDSCSELCRPRDDLLGHYSCNRLGQRVCLAGWEGPECTQAICSELCIPSRGTCTRPGTCTCRHGWYGEHCDKCRTYPGCVHGICHLPTQCVCLKGWSGPLCDVELLFCQHHNPCQNGATCYHDNNNNYTCGCPAGYTGAHCEVSECHAHFCMNGGSCQIGEGTRYCLCTPHFAGPRCQHRLEKTSQYSGIPCVGQACSYQTEAYRLECTGSGCREEHPPCKHPPCSPRMQVPTHKPCMGEQCIETNVNTQRTINSCQRHLCHNNGRCTELDNLTTPVCKCPFPFIGAHCLQVLNTSCTTNPCLNNGVCTTTESSRAFYCSCGPKHTGKLCEIKLSIFKNEMTVCERNGLSGGKETSGVVCHNGGKCEKSRRGGRFYCKCSVGFTGEFCEIDNSNPCLVHKCLHGGECSVGRNSTPICACPAGYKGVSCHVRVEPWCERVTCQNGGSCIDHNNSFTCACRGGYEGRYCENPIVARKTIRVEIKTSMNVCCGSASVRLKILDVIFFYTICIILKRFFADP